MKQNLLLNIAIDNYTDRRYAPLNNAVNDAKKLEEVLLTKYNFVTVQESLFNENASRKNIIEALTFLSGNTTSDDNLIINFSGHGSINLNTRIGFWVPQDVNDSISSLIPNSTVIDALLGIEAKHILLIVDSCFSGTFLNQSKSAQPTYYEKLDSVKSRWVLTSGRVEKVSDGQPGKGSPFSIFLNEFLDQKSKTTFSVIELASAVLKATGNTAKQQPVLAHIEGVGHLGGQMVFNILEENQNEISISNPSNLSRIVISKDTALKIKEIGINSKSIFAYYKEGEKDILKMYKDEEDLICFAYTYEEMVEFIPEMIEVDEDVYLARFDGYDKIRDLEAPMGEDFAAVKFQRTDVKDTPYMALCTCRGKMVAFSKTPEGMYNNLIRWGINQAETAALMIIALVEEKRITIGNNKYT